VPGRIFNAMPVLLLLAGCWGVLEARAADQIQSKSTGPVDLSTVVERMEQAARSQRESVRPYVVTREYQMFAKDDLKPKSEVTAQVSFVPPSSREFRITETRGSDRGESIVRHILEGEQKTTESGSKSTAITRENYDFAMAGEQVIDGHHCYVLELTPKRKEKSLVRGRAWVDGDTYLVRKIEGEMAKMPSWWIKGVSLSLMFGEVGGMWMQTATTAIAELRLVGEHTLTSRLVSFQPSGVVANNRAGTTKLPQIRRFSVGDANLGAGLAPRR